MKHQWTTFGYDRDNPFTLRRRCEHCRVVQTKESEQLWGRVVGYYWRPLAGRCKGKPVRRRK